MIKCGVLAGILGLFLGAALPPGLPPGQGLGILLGPPTQGFAHSAALRLKLDPSEWLKPKALDPEPCGHAVQLERAGLIDASKDGEGIKGVEDQEMLMAIMDARELIEGTQVRAWATVFGRGLRNDCRGQSARTPTCMVCKSYTCIGINVRRGSSRGDFQPCMVRALLVEAAGASGRALLKQHCRRQLRLRGVTGRHTGHLRLQAQACHSFVARFQAVARLQGVRPDALLPQDAEALQKLRSDNRAAADQEVRVRSGP